MNRKPSVGIVGVGYMGALHAEKLAALADRWTADPRPWAREQMFLYLVQILTLSQIYHYHIQHCIGLCSQSQHYPCVSRSLAKFPYPHYYKRYYFQ